MKKLLSVILAAIMTLSFAVVSNAVNIYVSGQIGGKLDNTSFNDDYNPIYIDVDIPLDNWKFGIEYNTGTWKYLYDIDIAGYLLKAGYAVVNRDSVRAGLNLGLYYQQFKGTGAHSGADYKYNNDFLVGADAAFKLSNELKLDLTYDTFISGKLGAPSGDLDINTIQLYKIKFTYQINQNCGISAGYRAFVTQPNPANNTILSGAGYTLGVCYNF